MNEKGRIYITHCCAKKDDSLRGTGKNVLPDQLYTATPTRRFLDRCKTRNVKWAIFSDLYGVWFPDVAHPWYEKDPNLVTELQFQNLLNDFNRKLGSYSQIRFYHNPRRFHRLYRRLLEETSLRERIVLFRRIAEIV
jgi:hypothetical protein